MSGYVFMRETEGKQRMEKHTDKEQPSKVWSGTVDIGNIRFSAAFNTDKDRLYVPWQVASHSHNEYEVFFIWEGAARVEFSGRGGLQRISLERDDFCVIYPQIYHNTVNTESEAYVIGLRFSFKKIPCHEKKEDFYHLFNTVLETNKNYILLKCAGFRGIFGSIIEENKLSQFLKQYSFKAKLTLFFLELFDVLKIGVAKSENAEKMVFTDKSARFMKIEHFFSQKEQDDVTLKDLADSLYLSKKQTSRVLKMEFNISFLQLLTQKKLEYAKELLRNTNLSIGKIAELSGYKSLAGFSKAMKKVMGKNPSVYRIINRPDK